MRCFALACGITAIFGPSLASTFDIGPHDKYLRENFAVSEARKYWNENEWWIECIFVDLNQDGFVEIISSSSSQSDRSGNAWSFWTTRPDGKLHMIREDRLAAERFSFNCFCDSYYMMKSGSSASHVVGLGMCAGAAGADNILRSSKSPDCIFNIAENDQLSVSPITQGLDAVFLAEPLARIERLYSESFSGFEFRPVPESLVIVWRGGYKHPKPMPVSDAPDGFGAFAASFKKEAQMRSGATNDVPIYAVFLDADNDGHADCYMTSEADCVEKDVYRWFLYKNAAGKFVKARDAVHPVAGRDDLPTLNPGVLARKDAFCRIIRFDVPPTYIVLDAAKVEKGMVKKTITYRWTHSIEKLPCHVY